MTIQGREPTGLIIGKFMPPHLGHLHLIEQARARVERLTVILFTRPRDPIPGELRLCWLRELLPGVTVLRIEQDLPVDFQSPAVWEQWIEAIRSVYPAGPSLVFSSEDYGEELARRLRARDVLVDRDRSQVPVSATMIRERPEKYGHFLPPCVRGFFLEAGKAEPE